jgi:hypothetical protein
VYAGKRELDGGLRLGFRYNELSGAGFGGGAYATKRISRVVQLHCTFGVGIYPNAEDQLRGHEVPENAEFVFPPPSINWGLNGGIFLFP